MTKFVMPTTVDANSVYIICPDTRCTGFTKPVMQCSKREDGCPRKDEAKLVIACHCGCLVEERVDKSRWGHCKCNCGAILLTTISATTTYRIPKRYYKKFKRLTINY